MEKFQKFADSKTGLNPLLLQRNNLGLFAFIRLLVIGPLRLILTILYLIVYCLLFSIKANNNAIG